MKSSASGHWAVIVPVVVASISIATIIKAEPERDKKMVNTEELLLSSLDGMSATERELVLKNVEEEWQATKGVLIQNLSSEQEQTRFCAAYLLGLYRYSDASDSLAKVITMENKDYPQDQSREPRWGQYPAVEALIRIGKPSIPAMLRNLETSDDEHVRGLSARVIYYVEGPELSKVVLQNAIANQAETKKKKKLESGASLVRGGEYKKPAKP